MDELFVQVPSVTVGVRNDEKRPAIHTLGSVHRLHGPSLTPLTEGVGSCSSWTEAGGGACSQTHESNWPSVTCMLHACSLTHTHTQHWATLPQSSHSTPISPPSSQAPKHLSIQSCWPCPRDQNQKHAGGSAAQCTGRSLRQPEALPRPKVAHQRILLLFGVPRIASTFVRRGDVKRSEDQTKHSVDRNPRTSGTSGTAGYTAYTASTGNNEGTVGRTWIVAAVLHTHSALDARTYCSARRSSRVGLDMPPKEESNIWPPQHTTASSPHHISLPCRPRESTTIAPRSLALQDSSKNNDYQQSLL